MKNRDRPVRVGVVGCGSFGRYTYARNVADNADANLVALCDVDPTRAEATAREFFDERDRKPRPTIYTDYQEMIDKESLDIAMVAVMADFRPRVSIAALNSGAHVLAAKPMARSLADAAEMMQTAEQVGRILMIGYNFRFRDDAQAVHRFIQSGGMGKTLFARAWAHAGSVPARGRHHIKSISGGGALASTGIHIMDLAVWFLGSPPVLSVQAESRSRLGDLSGLPPQLEAIRDDYDVEDLLTGYVRFADGATLSVESMWLTPPQITNDGVDVWGTKGYASLTPLRLLTFEDGDYVDKTEQVAPGLAGVYRDAVGPRKQREVHHFIDCALGRATPIVTAEEMWTNQTITDGLYAGKAVFKE